MLVSEFSILRRKAFSWVNRFMFDPAKKAFIGKQQKIRKMFHFVRGQDRRRQDVASKPKARKRCDHPKSAQSTPHSTLVPSGGQVRTGDGDPLLGIFNVPIYHGFPITADWIPDQMAKAYRSPDPLSYRFSGRWSHCRRSEAQPRQQFAS